MNNDLSALVRYRLQQGKDALLAAKKLYDAELWRDAINRAYYAQFYSVLGLLAIKGLGTSKHSGAVALFDREYVKTSVFGKRFSQMLHRAFDMRQEADYEEMACLGQEEAEQVIDNAEEFLQAVGKQISKFLESLA